MLLAIAIGVPLGIFLTRRPAWKTLVLGTNSVIQTIPSLALFGLLLPLPWLGARADRLAVFALTLYALLPIIQNTYTGIADVSPPVREAATAMQRTKSARCAFCPVLYQFRRPMQGKGLDWGK